MNEHEIERIAAAMNQLRPDWPTKSLHTLLSKPALASRPRRDVTVALAWVACETATAKPARVLEAGPWWRAAAIEGQAQARESFDASAFCGICGDPRDRCQRKWAGEHEFESVAHSIARHATDETDVPRVVEALKGELVPMSPPPEPAPRVPNPHVEAARAELHPTHPTPARVGAESEEDA